MIQPSEILKLAMPLMLAWWFQKREGPAAAADFAIAGVILLLVPVALVVKQPTWAPRSWSSRPGSMPCSSPACRGS